MTKHNRSDSASGHSRIGRTLTHSLMIPSLLLLLSGAAGCAPQVLHGPRVDPGASGALTVGATSAFNPNAQGADVAAVVYGGARHGWVSEDDQMAASFGVQVPLLSMPFVGVPEDLEVLAQVSYADLYFQPVRSVGAGTDYGVGVVASTLLLMPYVQYGRTGTSGNSWYTTQGLLIPPGETTMWMPSISFRDVGNGTGTAVNYTAGAGVGLADGFRQRVLTLSITAELGLDRK